MKTIFDKDTQTALISRINALHVGSTAQWGKMNVFQMVKHCTLWEEMIAGKATYKQLFMGRLFGKILLKMVLKDESPMRKNSPTIPEFIVTENSDLASEKEKWITLISQYDHFSNPGFIHPFFGKMTKEQIGYLVYKHTDHHLRQFNV